MTSNIFNNVAHITKEAMAHLEGQLGFTKHVRRWDATMEAKGAKHGDTINIRIPETGTYRSGRVAGPDGLNDSYVPITVAQGGADFTLTSMEELLNVDSMIDRIKPRITAIANEIDRAGLALYSQIPNFTGTPGTALTDFSQFLNARARLAINGAPDGDLAAVLEPFTQASMVNGLKALMNPVEDIAKQYKTGNLGKLAAGMAFSLDTNCPVHTVGTFGTSTPLMDGTTADGATSIVTNGWASGASALNASDCLEIAGVYAVNPITKVATSQRLQLRVTTAVSDTSGAMTISISPALIASGKNKNCSALPANDAAIYVFGANTNAYSAKVSPVNMVFHKDAFGLACIDLPAKGDNCHRVKADELGLSIRALTQYDAINDRTLFRFDVCYGWAVLRAAYACRVQGA